LDKDKENFKDRYFVKNSVEVAILHHHNTNEHL